MIINTSEKRGIFMILGFSPLDFWRKGRHPMLVRLVTGRAIGSEFSFLPPYRGARGVSLPVSSGLTSRCPPVWGFYFIFKEFVMVVRQTTIVESAILPVLGKFCIPGMKLIGWCEDREQDKFPYFSVFLEAESGKGECLFLEVELDDKFLPSGSNWALMKRDDVASFFAGGDLKYEGHNFLVSQDSYWRKAIEAGAPSMK
jgi:hypothetical protein